MSPSDQLPQRWAKKRLAKKKRYRVTPSIMQTGMIIGDAQSGQVFYLVRSDAKQNHDGNYAVDIEYPEDGHKSTRVWGEDDALSGNKWVIAHHDELMPDGNTQAIVGDQNE
jgi:hypothetical protein